MNKLFTGILFLLFFNAENHAQQASANGFFPAVNTCVLTDVQKQKATFITPGAKPLLLFIFLSPECPLCQNYTRIFNDIQQQYKEKLDVFGIVPGDAYSIKNITAFQKKYHTAFNCYSDKKLALTKYLQATVTPQVILLNANMQLLYTGAIDDCALIQQ